MLSRPIGPLSRSGERRPTYDLLAEAASNNGSRLPGPPHGLGVGMSGAVQPAGGLANGSARSKRWALGGYMAGPLPSDRIHSSVLGHNIVDEKEKTLGWFVFPSAGPEFLFRSLLKHRSTTKLLGSGLFVL